MRKRAAPRKRPAPKKPSTAAKARAAVTGALKGAVAAVTKRLPRSATDAITLLENDHRRLEDLMARVEKTGERAVKKRKALLDEIAAALTIHETIEERVLYPALSEHPETRDIVLEGFQEHHVADLIMKEIFDTPLEAETWGAKFKVFKENIEHHIEEEEGPMFRTARGVMTRDELDALGERMAAMKRDAERGK
jgi:hemerythrin-like domain-containing protein